LFYSDWSQSSRTTDAILNIMVIYSNNFNDPRFEMSIVKLRIVYFLTAILVTPSSLLLSSLSVKNVDDDAYRMKAL